LRSNRVFILVICVLAFAALAFAGGTGFRSKVLLDDHFEKHGREFGHITELQYLQLAQQLRDSRAGGNSLEARRPDGVFSKFDRKRGYFGAYDPDGTIRTFFIPADGARYFERQEMLYGRR
jgi:pyocin large subunit-like protein